MEYLTSQQPPALDISLTRQEHNVLSRDYFKATSEFSHQLPPTGYWGCLLAIHNLGGGGYVYHAAHSAKCRKCRHAKLRRGVDRKGHEFHELASTGYTCPSCGNPFCARTKVTRYAAVAAGKLH